MRPWTVRSALALVVVAAMLGAATVPAAAQDTGKIQGQVVDAVTKAPLAGAQVFVVGTEIGGLTNANGRFLLLNVPAGVADVRVQMIGYEGQTRTVNVPAGGTARVDVELSTAAVALDEIVVTGTAGGTQKRALGNVVATVDAEDLVEIAPVNNFQELMNGRTPGVAILSGTGMVGGGSKIRIRGASSFSLSNEPLIYIDGVRVNNDQATGPTNQGFGSNAISRWNDLNPEDIESIEVIKGPAAATLYGTEASNGVIQIITKKGTAGEPQFTVSMSQGANWFANPEGRLWENWGIGPDGDTTTINYTQLEENWGEPIFQTGHLQEYDLSVRGGTDRIRYYASGNVEHNEGVERENTVRRYSGRLNLSITPSDAWDIDASLGYVTGRTNLVWEAGGGGVTWSTYFMSPSRLDDENRRGFWSGTPESYYNLVDTWQDVNRFTGSVQLRHHPTEWFTHRLTFGVDQTREENVERLNKDPRYLWADSWADRGYKSVTDRNVNYTTLDYSGTVNFDLTDAFSSSTSFGAQYYRKFNEWIWAWGEDFPAPGLQTIDAASIQRGGDDYIENVTVGVFGQQQFGWQDRVFLTLGLRADDNSAFGSDFDLVYYPKTSASWVVSEEPFFDVPFITTLKLRAAYGQSGQQPDAFAALRTFAPVTGPGDEGVVTPDAIGNAELGPERGEEIEVGFDASFFEDRFGLEVTYYNQTTRDAILLREIAPSTGFAGLQYVNAGEIRNSGLEVLATAQPVLTDDVAWDVTLNLSTNDNEVVSLGDVTDADYISAGSYLEHRIGYPVGSWFEKRVVSAELDADGNAVNLMCDDGNGGTVSCDEAPRVYLGRTTPSLEGALSSSVTLFGNLRLYAQFDYKAGYHKLDGNLRVRCFFFDLCREVYYPQDYDATRIASFQNRIVDVLIDDADFMKLRELSASYTLPESWAAGFGASRATVTLAGRNLYTWTAYQGLEPEAMFLGGSRGGNHSLWEQNVLPQLSQFVASVKVNF